MTMCMLGGDDHKKKIKKRITHSASDMEMRDYFAGFALQGILTKGYIDVPNVKDHVKSAYKIADMMMKERDK